MKVRRSVSLWIVVMLSTYALRTFAAGDWTAQATKLAQSVVYIQSDDGSCTGFVIHSHYGDKGNKDLILTADHCFAAGLYADREPARVVSKDPKKDLMVLEIDNTDKPALLLAKHNPHQGEVVASFGYGYALERPMLRITTIADDNTYIPQDGIGGPLMVTDAAFVPGQSGGPVVNAAGEVVMIVQRGSGTVGLGVGAETIRSRMGRYLEKPPEKP